jgi:phosphopantothenoylcysteine decarboxylase/phosphopantothenate--cysteine ligase
MDPLQGRHVLLGIGGSIAAYKAALLVRELRAAGATVRAAPTRAGERFITALTLEALSGRPCLGDVLDVEAGEIPHVEEAYRADLVMVAPATANLMAKMAHGFADEALLATLLSYEGPLVVAPAMETRMWTHPATRENVATLKARGAHLVEPAAGPLASGRSGPGRLAPLEVILEVARTALTDSDLEGRHILVTAGPTAEDLDPVRFLTNRSSGRMGLALALAARRRGARVTLVHGPLAADAPPALGVHAVSVRSAQQMHDAVMDAVAEGDVDAAILAAAVADYTPATVHERKLKKDDGPLDQLALSRTPDILAALGARADPPLLVGFAAETEDVEANARKKLAKKGCDLICANDVSAAGVGFASEDNAVTLIRKDGKARALPKADKLHIAYGILDEVAELLGRA